VEESLVLMERKSQGERSAGSNPAREFPSDDPLWTSISTGYNMRHAPLPDHCRCLFLDRLPYGIDANAERWRPDLDAGGPPERAGELADYEYVSHQ
jgi:hypothetical protein